MAPMTNTEKQDKRKLDLQNAAVRDGWKKWSTALTDWIHGRAVLVKVETENEKNTRSV